MPTRSVELTPELEQVIAAQIATGRYQDANEVIRAALHEFDREEKLKLEDEAKMEALIQAIDEGEASGIYEGDPFEDIRASRKNRTRVAVTLG